MDSSLASDLPDSQLGKEHIILLNIGLAVLRVGCCCAVDRDLSTEFNALAVRQLACQCIEQRRLSSSR